MKIVFLMPQSFPYGIAYSSRAQNFSRALSELGYDVDVVCDYLSDNKYRIHDNIGRFENTRIYEIVPKKSKLDRFLTRPRLSSFLENYIQSEHPDLIISSSAYDRFPCVLHAARKYRIPIILESCEKYDSTNWRFGKADYRYHQFHSCWKWYYPKVDGVIAISRFLENYYSEQGLRTLRIPTILDVEKTESRTKCNHTEQRTFVFAGTLGGGKDKLVEFIRAMYEVRNSENCIPILNIYGPSNEQVEEQLGKYREITDSLKDQINFFGRIPQSQVANAVRQADFSLVIRPNRESSNAGFPTKLAESMAVGTPVFANKTGDIGVYVEDNINGLIADSDSEQDILKTLRRALKMSTDELEMMRMSARKVAIESFDYRGYESKLNQFVMDVINGGNRNGI